MTPDYGFPALPRLAKVEAIHVRVPFRRPFLDATGEFTHRRTWLFRIVDADGYEGLGEAALHPIAADVTSEALAALIREIVPEVVAGRLPGWSSLAVEGEPGRAAMAAVDGALGALLAARGAAGASAPAGAISMAGPAPQARALSAANLAPIPVSAAITFAGPDAGAEAAAQAVELGFGTLKLRAGFERATDQLVDRLRAIRAAVGPEPRLRIDAGGAWDLETAAERIAAIEPFRIEFVEQPLTAWDVAGHAALRERVRVPIALDESIDSEGSARAALAEGAVDVVIVKPARVGGLAATTRIVDAAVATGAGRATKVSVVLGTFFETGVGIAAALRIAATMRAAAAADAPAAQLDGGPNGARDGDGAPKVGLETAHGLEAAHGLATAGVLVHDLLGVPLPIEKGAMAVPTVVTLDELEVDRYAIERFEARR
jgi:L-alanine-DL-glutamate epimerase-like enolase superfamily enzyme